MEDKRSSAAPIVAIVLLLSLPCLYVGSYVVLVRRVTALRTTEYGLIAIEVGPSYTWGGDVSDKFFYPVHGLDRLLRPGYWDAGLGPLKIWPSTESPSPVEVPVAPK